MSGYPDDAIVLHFILTSNDTRPIYQVILAVLLSWMVCGILTAANVFSDNPKDLDYHARTDASVRVLQNAKWFFFPYPGTHSYYQ